MTTTQCAHHWVIETPSGPRSKGKCQLCGEEREFSNSTGFRSIWNPQAQRSPESPQPEEAEDALGLA